MSIRYSKKVFETVYDDFLKRRTLAESESQRRRAFVNAKSPRFGEIERELASLTAELIGVIASGADAKTAASRISEKSLSLQKERAQLLAGLGLPEDYLEIKRFCPLCKDTGYIGERMCSCYEKALREEAHKTFNLALYMPAASFETFRFDVYSDRSSEGRAISPRENAQLILKACKSFVRSFETFDKSLILWGEPGLGKTFLSSAIAHELIDRGYDVVYETAAVIFAAMEDLRFGRASEESQDRLQRVNDCDLLIIDDLGAEYVTPFVRSALFSVLNNRLLNNKKLIISTNLSAEELEQTYDSRIVSRIAGSFVSLELYGKDVRRVLRGEKP